jgi:flagellar basal body-associated protein FliL
VVEIIIQYVLIVLLVTGLGYLAYLLKDKGINIKDDYFGFAYVILGSLLTSDSTPENAKLVIRIVSAAVKYVEANYKNNDNEFKEKEAIKMAKNDIGLLSFKENIDDESIRYLTRLAAAALPPTNKVIEEITDEN